MPEPKPKKLKKAAKDGGKKRAFCFTFYKYERHEVDLVCLDYDYLVYGVEVCPSTGRWHLQGYIHFANPRSFKSVAALFRWHIEVANGSPSSNFDYCSKEGAFVEFGKRPRDKGSAGRDESLRWDTARIAAVEGRWDDIPADIYIRYLGSLRRIYKEDCIPRNPKPLDPARYYGVWIYGPPRTGKSHDAEHRFGSPVYTKPADRWWDDYRGETVVHVQDITPDQCRPLNGLIKLWADRWVFPAEVKGGYMRIRPKLLVFTSNYALDACFVGTELEAMQARFYTIEKTETYCPDNLPLLPVPFVESDSLL